MTAGNMMDRTFQVYELLDEYRRRPGLYAGNLGRDRPFTQLQNFLAGLMWANLDAASPPFREFSRWITARVPGMSHTLPWDWLLAKRGEAKAYEVYFERLSEFRKCRVVKIQTTEATPRPSFYRVQEGQRVEAEIPRALFIGRYDPTAVYFLLEEYAERSEKEFPFQTTPDEVKLVAEHRWGISPNSWQVC